MLQFQCLVVLLSLILIAFLLQIPYDYDYMVMRDGHRYVYRTFNSKHTSCDHSPSTCVGNDINLQCPFQFRGDHPNLCPIEFSCENNRTVLPVIGGNHLEKQQYNFSVELNSIDYEKQTLRLFDPGVQKSNCSTLPVYSFKPNDDYYQNQVGASTIMEIDPDAGSLVFVSCKNPVKSKYPPLYVDTASCNITANHFSKMKASSNYYSYVVVGKNVVASDIEESCTVYKTAPVDLRCLPNVTAGDISFQDIHNLLSNGLDLRWLREWRSRRHFPWLPQGRISDAIRSYRSIGVAALVYLNAAIKVIGIILLFAFLLYRCRRRHLSRYDTIEDFLQANNSVMPIRYSYKQIRTMTKNFKEKLGEGGYGLVYKGKLRSGGGVAVKMLNKSKANGQEFINEVATIGRIHHVNVVRLVGFCVTASKHALVYDYMPNGSLDKLIFSNCQNGSPLSWKQVCEIAKGVARGIEYLHQGCDMQILHFDIKPHNILLDENFVPKVSDFGLAKLYPMQKSIATLTAARGTLGYMAPELFYKKIGRVSHKTDVYSYGMLLMEMAGRRRNVDAHAEHSSQIYFPSWIYDKFDQVEEMEIGDHATEEEKTITRKLILIALWCIQMTPEDRPSMREVLDMLEGGASGLKLPPKPSFYPPDSPISMQRSSDSSSSDESMVPLCSSVALEIEQMDD
ncbi:LEAF RUST 10 DISEASE-RESISTANCE LOCUS RECEPTOR-LIKE PROTEIN KINASE-like 2.1 isoform X1 [Coffea eugenioides]|uniref:LEAF RUST 10 DISEASE-RESISTANCE LOCUS RECEPTOR-LIKE PROTEIN KINASE-like 2.1 isoform X1 n=1 Tax=Coffea eugenioides TaxID=49369 RepID=UPI000F60AB0D|nr:LEAF RUST 10 DISEASE-RESISTANCE LOCUS RECEPTOR-LIKE PROTEIN KINASE-like 2.1 isoform X1 [Coffea eugenioides]